MGRSRGAGRVESGGLTLEKDGDLWVKAEAEAESVD